MGWEQLSGLRGDYGAARISRVQREDAPRLHRAENLKRSAPGLYRIDTPDEGRELRMAAGISASSKQELNFLPNGSRCVALRENRDQIRCWY